MRQLSLVIPFLTKPSLFESAFVFQGALTLAITYLANKRLIGQVHFAFIIFSPRLSSIYVDFFLVFLDL